MTPATPMIVSIKPAAPRPRLRRAFSLIEVLVAVTLMSVIVLGLIAMFSQTQRAFRAGITQVDVMEGGRAACELLARELEQTTPTGRPNTLNFFSQWNGYALIQSLPGKSALGDPQWRTNIVDDVFFFTRENRNWQGVGYRVESPDFVGTLYRYETNVANLDLDLVTQADSVASPVKFRDRAYSTRASRIIDGVVHFRVLAYDNNGHLIINNSGSDIGVTNRYVRGNILLPPDLSYEYHFRSNAVPAYLELELGILEAKTAERCRNLDLTAQPKFLESKSGNVQIFRQRITLRNVDPTVYP
jgi:prepilin-type N-terminal cleavage/methylation domain-containing protein